MKTKLLLHRLFIFLILLTFTGLLHAQIPATAKKYVRVGSLQSHFSAYGSERAWTGGTGAYYAGLQWPADYPYTDNAVIRRAWLGADNFTDADGKVWSKYGIYFVADDVDLSLFPVELSEKSKYALPKVYVDGFDVNAVYAKDYDVVDPNLIADRVVNNVVNTKMGLTMKRTIYAFSQQYHDNYFIKRFVFTNTGNTDYDDEIELNKQLNGVYVSWGTRYSVSRDGAGPIGDGQSWGKHTVVTRRGETYAANYMQTITEATPIESLDWLRANFAWAGQAARNSFDNIGGPDLTERGRLAAPQHAGLVTIHVDKSTSDPEDDPNQPSTLGWHAGDTYPSIGNLQQEYPMVELYDMLMGNPHDGLGGTNRFDETYITTETFQKDPWTVHNDGGGTNIWVSYGPFDIPPGDSIVIVEAEAINGLSREMCEEIGHRWYKAYLNPADKGPFDLPDGSTTTDKDIFKNRWVFTGKDSIMQSFSRAKRNFDSGMNIPQPPAPPAVFNIESGGDKISLSWSASDSEGDADFGGYRVFRGVGKPDTSYTEIFACGLNTDHPEIVNSFDDRSAVRGVSYYYYVVAFNDGSNNTDGITNPTGELHSGRFYTQTTSPAFLQRLAGEKIKDVRIIPNPYNSKARNFNYPGEPNKITFLNIPAYCTLRIFTERGDLVKTIKHTNGSGDESWDLLTSTRQMLASGLYILHVEVTKTYEHPATGKIAYKKGDQVVKKFVVIR